MFYGGLNEFYLTFCRSKCTLNILSPWLFSLIFNFELFEPLSAPIFPEFSLEPTHNKLSSFLLIQFFIWIFLLLLHSVHLNHEFRFWENIKGPLQDQFHWISLHRPFWHIKLITCQHFFLHVKILWVELIYPWTLFL